MRWPTVVIAAVAEQPGLQWVDVPDTINVTADHGRVVRAGAPAAAQAFADHLLSAPGAGCVPSHWLSAA